MDWPYIKSNRPQRFRDKAVSTVVLGGTAVIGLTLLVILWPVLFLMFLHDDRNNYDNIEWRE